MQYRVIYDRDISKVYSNVLYQVCFYTLPSQIHCSRFCRQIYSAMLTTGTDIISSLLSENVYINQYWSNFRPMQFSRYSVSLHWRHNGRDSVSNHQPYDCLFTQPFIQTQIKENIKAPRHWPLCGEFTEDRWIPHTNGQQRGKCFHLMTSCHFLVRKGTNWQQVIIGSEEDLVPYRREAIISTNDGLIKWRIYASLGLDEIMTSI